MVAQGRGRAATAVGSNYRERIEAMHKAAETLGLYLSVPFCRAKCSFCNFASGVGSAEAMERYVELLCAETTLARTTARRLGAELPEVVDTVYLGGGTPSLLAPTQITRIFNAICGEFQVANDAEITLEAAPGQIADSLLESAMGQGVNRISLGVQSFVNREAQGVGRTHTEESCLAEFQRLRNAGIANIGADLIAGLPYQTEESWEHSMEVARSSGLAHLSVYMLEIDEESRLGREVLGGGARLHAPALPSDEVVAAMYERACEWLPGAGFAQYEISNFGQPGSRSRHNLKYWTRQPYLGLGLDAHSMLVSRDGRAVRWANPEELGSYDGAPGVASAERVSERAQFEEIVFLGLRLLEGLRVEQVAVYPRQWTDALLERARMLADEGMLEMNEVRLRLTQRGRLVSSAVFGELLLGDESREVAGEADRVRSEAGLAAVL